MKPQESSRVRKEGEGVRSIHLGVRDPVGPTLAEPEPSLSVAPRIHVLTLLGSIPRSRRTSLGMGSAFTDSVGQAAAGGGTNSPILEPVVPEAHRGHVGPALWLTTKLYFPNI